MSFILWPLVFNRAKISLVNEAIFVDVGLILGDNDS